jgi:phosphate starvation-inducible PhoH-like protein
MTKKSRKRDENHELVSEIYDNLNKNVILNYEIKTPYKFNEKHSEFLHLLQTNKTKMVFVDGPAGTAKTYIAVLAGLFMLKEHYIDQIVYIRSIVESASKQMGALPGEVNDKFLPWSMPLIEKVNEISGKFTADNLYKAEMIKGLPVNFCRGLTFNKSLVIVDEAQNLTKEELTTILTRFGHKSKYVIVGDTFQSDIRNSGFKDVYNAFNTEFSIDNQIFCLKFGNDEIVRSEILKHIVKVLESIPKSQPHLVPANRPE